MSEAEPSAKAPPPEVPKKSALETVGDHKIAGGLILAGLIGIALLMMDLIFGQNNIQSLRNLGWADWNATRTAQDFTLLTATVATASSPVATPTLAPTTTLPLAATDSPEATAAITASPISNPTATSTRVTPSSTVTPTAVSRQLRPPRSIATSAPIGVPPMPETPPDEGEFGPAGS
jgi:hypothetical protein